MNNVEGVVGPSTSEVHEEALENYIEGMGSNIGLENHEDKIVDSVLESLHGGEMKEN